MARRSGRPLWVGVHRWAGLFMALFLVVAGVTGSIIAFYEPLDAWLNPERHATAHPPGAARLDPVTLHERALAHAAPYAAQVRLDSIGLERDRPASFIAEARIDPATGTPFAGTPREFVLDAYTGALLHIRMAEAPLWPIHRGNVLDVIYRLHYSLALPGSVGIWLFGIAALVWTLDCFIGLYLTFPISRTPGRPARDRWLARWAPAWRVRWGGGSYKLNFDLHRAGGLWVWLMLLILAWSSVALNLNEQVYQPVMSRFFDMRRPGSDAPPRAQPLQAPALGWRDALARARTLAAERAQVDGFKRRGEISLDLDRATGLYSYRFLTDADISPGNGAYLNFDADTGRFQSLVLGSRLPFGPWLTDWITALHMAQVWGLPMKVFISAMGLVVTLLSVTGVVIWWKKRKARRATAAVRALKAEPTRA